ncbi:MAG: SBBP repeat-containing protein [Myxococcota bacterium]
MLKRTLLIISLFTFIAGFGCDDDSSTNNTNNVNNTNNSNECEGEAPLADLQKGVCSGLHKVCDPETSEWIEPDYSLVDNYESEETSCDDLDNDCDGLVDEELAVSDYYPDNDNDGFGDADAQVLSSCATPVGYVLDNTDCDDGNQQVHPEAEEVCNGIDDNCDGVIDSDAVDQSTWYLDSDEDGYGDPSDSVEACSQPAGYVDNDSDCDPSDPAHWSDCSSCTDEDGDNYGSGCDLGPDCDDSMATGSSCHNSCLTWYLDNDGDGHGDPTTDTVACTAPNNHVASNDDCDDSTQTGAGCHNTCSVFYEDSDGDSYGDPASSIERCSVPSGYTADNTDCDPDNGDIHPDALEICDGIDNNCDSTVDAGDCQDNASCWDDGGTVAAQCVCDNGYLETTADPGVCYQVEEPVVGDLSVNEIMIEPLHANSTGEGQYFEIYNTSDATLNITNLEFMVDNGTVSETSQIVEPAILFPGEYFVVGTSTDLLLNGGVEVDFLMAVMPQLERDYGNIILLNAVSGDTIDSVLWDNSFNHVAGKSLNLSPGALATNPGILNDDSSHWCNTRYTQLTSSDYGTPGADNDDCLVNWCVLQFPDTLTITAGETTDPVYGRVYEPGITENSGQGAFIQSQLGYGPENTEPTTASWGWFDADFNVDVGNDDEYSQTLAPAVESTYDYAYRFSLDGGLTWLYCDTSGAHGDGSSSYDPVDSGVLTVEPIPAGLYYWSVNGGSNSPDFSNDIAVDSSGNSYITGSFQSNADFGSTTLSSNGLADVFVAKYDSDGNFLWARSAGGTDNDSGESIAVDEFGNSYITGYFEGTFDIGSLTLYSSGDREVFVAKYNADGNLLWARSGGGNLEDWGFGIAVDGSGNCYITGKFENIGLFGGLYIYSSDGDDIFIVKYDSSGSVVWAESAGGVSNETGYDIAVDNYGNLYLTGYFSNDCSFDGGSVTLYSSGYTDIFIAKYNTDGTFSWAKKAGGNGYDQGTSLAIDENQDCYLTGDYADTASFSVSNITSVGDKDIFIAKYTHSGTLAWVKSAGGIDEDKGFGIAVDNNENTYLTGYFENDATFGYSANSVDLVSVGGKDVFIAKLDSDGSLVWAKSAGGVDNDRGSGIGVDWLGNNYTTGEFWSSITFDGSTLSSNGSFDAFITKLAP